MRIQQQLHSSPWNIRAISELPIVLKSSGTENRPRRNPSLRTCFPVGVSRAVTLTIGLPALAMINGFPPAASSTKRDSCVLALWMLTVITKTPIELSLVSLVQHGLSVKNLVLLCSLRALKQTLHQRKLSNVIQKAGSTCHRAKWQCPEHHCASSKTVEPCPFWGFSRQFIDASMAEPELASRVVRTCAHATLANRSGGKA